MLYVGIVEDTNDPLKLSRCKVRVLNVHDERLSKIKTDDLPWASVMMPTTSASISGIGHSPSGLLEGSMVIVMFIDGAKQQPIILGSVHGIPLDKSGLYTKTSEDDIIKFDTTRNDGVVVDDSNEVVTDGSGQPVQTENKQEDKSKEQLEVELNDISLIPTDPPAGSNGSKAGIAAIIKVCKENGITERRVVAAILGICGGESKWKPQAEDFTYSKKRIIEVFPSIFATKSEVESGYPLATKYANNPKELPEFIYGADKAKGKGLGNKFPGDGAKYIGRGLIQLTGRSNYEQFAKLSGTDIVNNPDLLNSDIEISAKVAVAFVKTKARYDLNKNSENFFEIAKKVVGRNTPDIAAKKKAYYDYFMGGPQPSGKDAENAEIESTTNKQPAKEFNIIKDNSEVIKKSTKIGGVGFKDPDGKFPLYTKEQDTSRLARNQKISETIVKKKISRRTTGIPTPYKFWDEQRPPYSAQYPHNKVFETHSGHVIEIDDSPGAERIHVYHRSGSYLEIDNTGSMTTKIVGSNYRIVNYNDYLYVEGQLNITTEGSANLVVGGTLAAVVSGSALVSVNEDARVVAENVVVESAGTLDLKAAGAVRIQGSTIDLKGSEGVFVSGSVITAKGVIDLNGSAKDAAEAKSSNLKRVAGVNEDILDDPVPNSFDRETEISFESSDDGDYREHQRKLIESGLATPEQLTAKPEEGAKSDPERKDNDEPIKGDCETVKMLQDFPPSLRLSPNFTLGSVSSEAVVSKAKVVAQNGLSKEDIICNLQNICLNVLEPLKNMYPKMFVTSGFRQGSGSSQHLKGEAVDIQFTGVSKEKYFEIAKELAEKLPIFDQLLLEYKNYGSKNPWIHISCTKGSNRRQVLTFWNDQKYSQGLIDLGTKTV